MFRLIADSGSTKTDWALVSKNGHEMPTLYTTITTAGINPVRDSKERCRDVIQQELLPALSSCEQFKNQIITEIRFFGAGCTSDFSPIIHDALQQAFPKAVVDVESDMLGAAIALCGKEEGIVCILGTGSNSCLYDGMKIVDNISPLGWILGDEGSGAVLGRTLVGDVLKRQLPETLCKDFFQAYPLTSADIIQKVYREPQANRFLASLVPFIVNHRAETAMKDFLCTQFTAFLRRNVALYHRTDLPVHFTGGIAWQFADELRATLHKEDFICGRIEKTPLLSLIQRDF